MAAGTEPAELSLPWPVLRRFLVTVFVWSVALAAPAAALAYVWSQRSQPSYLAEVTLLAPRRAVELTDIEDPPVAPPLAPRAYRSALRTPELLADAWSRLTGRPAEEAPPDELATLGSGVTLQWDEMRRSITLVVGVKGPSASAAVARANAVADALVAWDDARARAVALQVTRSLEQQLATLQEQAAALRAADNRTDPAQMAAVSLLAVRVRESVAFSRAQAVAARGNLDILQPATRAAQVAPNPVVNAATVFVLVAMAVLAVVLVRAGLDRRVHGASGLAEVAGVPVLADLTRRRSRTIKGGFSELGFLKAQLDRAVAPGGEVLIAGVNADAAAQKVASDLGRLYAQAGEGGAVKVGTAALGTGEALERAAKADAVVLVAEPLGADRVELQQLMSWLNRVRANVVGLVAAEANGARRTRRARWRTA